MSKVEDCLVDARMPTKFGTFQLYAFPGDDDTKEDLALVMGKIEGRMLVRVHSECFTGDVLHSMRCDCGEQLDLAMERIAKEGVEAMFAGKPICVPTMTYKILVFMLKNFPASILSLFGRKLAPGRYDK